MTCKISRATFTHVLPAHGIQMLRTSLPLRKIAVDIDRVRLVKGAPLTIYCGRLDAHCSRLRSQALRSQHTSGSLCCFDKDLKEICFCSTGGSLKVVHMAVLRRGYTRVPSQHWEMCGLGTPHRTCVSYGTNALAKWLVQNSAKTITGQQIWTLKARNLCKSAVHLQREDSYPQVCTSI